MKSSDLDRYPRRLGEARQRLQSLRQSPEYGAEGHPVIGTQALMGIDMYRFSGAIDTLLDMEVALSRFWERLSKQPRPNQLECLGVLSAVYLQQDAVCIIAELTKQPKPDLRGGMLGEIRALRNRIAGHASYAEKQDPPGSIMWKPDSIEPHGFEVVIYEGNTPRPVKVLFKTLIVENSNGLADVLEQVLEAIS